MSNYLPPTWTTAIQISTSTEKAEDQEATVSSRQLKPEEPQGSILSFFKNKSDSTGCFLASDALKTET